MALRFLIIQYSVLIIRHSLTKEKMSNLEVLLHPLENTTEIDNTSSLESLYEKAFLEAEELYIVSAFLRNWKQDRPQPNANKIKIIIGVDFFITEPKACRDLLNWAPIIGQEDMLFAATGIKGFHPKLLAWSYNGSYNVVLGSSNLTNAAFTSNYEANANITVTKKEFLRIVEWINAIEKLSTPINGEWIKDYAEEWTAKRPQKPSKRLTKQTYVVESPLPEVKRNFKEFLARRKIQQENFERIKPDLLRAMRKCSQRKTKAADAEFYETMWALWNDQQARFQDGGFHILGKAAKWHQSCEAILDVLKYDEIAEINLDKLVASKINQLAKLKNPTRRSWFSEMLCHLLPSKFPVWDQPVDTWMALRNAKPVWGSTQGEKYIFIARHLRKVLDSEQCYPGVEDLTQLDAAIVSATSRQENDTA